jgi:PleD family two-component response regulator
MNNSIKKEMDILIADSDIETLKDVSATLNKVQPDWRLSVLNSGKQCLDILKNGNCPDAIILGMQLSDMSSFELIGQIRDDSDVLVIVISDDKEMRILEEAFEIGANDYILKPINKNIFMARLKALIRRREETSMGWG